jgi:hypothetical protein
MKGRKIDQYRAKCLACDLYLTSLVAGACVVRDIVCPKCGEECPARLGSGVRLAGDVPSVPIFGWAAPGR